MDLGNFQVMKAVLHEVPVKSDLAAEDAVKLSEVESILEPRHVLYFKERICSSIGSNWAHEVRFDPTSESPIPNLVKTYLKCPLNNSNFIEISQLCAKHLYCCQTKRSPEGIFAALECTYQGGPALVLMKLERESGVRVERATREGKVFFEIQLIDDLVLTDQTKVFKVGLFWKGQDKDIEGVVSDQQRAFRISASEVAQFFLIDFLGAQLKVSHSVATRRFVDTVGKFINKEIHDPSDKLDTYGHLVSTLTDQRDFINPSEFINNCIPLNLRQKCHNEFVNASVPFSVFKKDDDIVEKAVAQMRIDFQSGISIQGPEDSFRDKVHTEILEGGVTKAEITDKITRVGQK